MNEGHQHSVANPDFDSAGFEPVGIKRGGHGSMTLKEMRQKLSNFLRRKGDKPRFGWVRRVVRERARRRQAAQANVKTADRLSKSEKPIEFRSALQHRSETKIRKFRVRENDPWKKL